MPALSTIRDHVSLTSIRTLRHDLSQSLHDELLTEQSIAWDIETTGLNPDGSLIGTCQIHARQAGTIIVSDLKNSQPPHLSSLLSDKRVKKVFHHAPFDLTFMQQAWGANPRNVACTKIAAKILNPGATSTSYSLKSLLFERFGIHTNKETRFTDWTSETLSREQLLYAAGDVIKLLDLHDALLADLKRKGLIKLYRDTAAFLPTHVRLRIEGCADPFSY